MILGEKTLQASEFLLGDFRKSLMSEMRVFIDSCNTGYNRTRSKRPETIIKPPATGTRHFP